MKMYEIERGLAVPDRLTVALMPKGRHLMFMDLDRQLKRMIFSRLLLNLFLVVELRCPLM